MNAVKLEFLTSIAWNWACVLLQATSWPGETGEGAGRKGIPAAEFELLDDVANLLKPVHITVLCTGRV